jgi:hypothetical protein
LFHAAQSIEMLSDDINILNKRLQWQIINQIKDLRYVKLNQSFLRLMIFTNSSFANNRDLFSQIDYVICLADATHANILHWSSIKCKRVIRSVLSQAAIQKQDCGITWCDYNHVMWLQSRDVTKMTVYRTK